MPEQSLVKEPGAFWAAFRALHSDLWLSSGSVPEGVDPDQGGSIMTAPEMHVPGLRPEGLH